MLADFFGNLVVISSESIWVGNYLFDHGRDLETMMRWEKILELWGVFRLSHGENPPTFHRILVG